MKKLLRKFLPHHDAIDASRWLKLLGPSLRRADLWHLNRRSVAGGVAIGLFCGLIPGPIQMIAAALCSVWLRGNLPVALFTTLYTNPFTIVPLYLFAYRLGERLSGAQDVHTLPPEAHWYEWGGQMTDWLLSMGKPLLIGLPLLAACLAIAGYVLVRIAWRISVSVRWRARRRNRCRG